MKKICKINFFEIIFVLFLIACIAIGIFIRSSYYFHPHHFFSDELFLIINISSCNYFQLFLPLSYSQVCPPLLMCIFKAIYSVFGLNEYALTFVQYFCSILCLFSFVYLESLVFKNRFAILLGTFVFAINPEILYYSYVLKQYQIDLFSTILLLIIAIFLNKKIFSSFENIQINKNRCLIVAFLLGILSVLFIFFSYTSSILLLSIFIIFFIKTLIAKYKNVLNISFKDYILILCSYLLPFVIVLIFFISTMIPVMNDPYLKSFWSSGAYNTFIFYPNNLPILEKYIWFFIIPGTNYIVALILLCISCLYLFVKDKFIFFLMLTPVSIVYILGVFGLYPFCPSRVSVFLIPVFILLLFKSLDLVNVKRKLNIILSIYILFLLFSLTNTDKILKVTKNLFNEYNSHSYGYDYINLLTKTDYSPEDYIFGSIWEHFCMNMYDKKSVINEKKIIHGDEPETYYPKLNQIPKGSVIWFYIIDDNNLSHYTLDNKMKEQEESWRKENTKEIYTIIDNNGILIKTKKIK